MTKNAWIKENLPEEFHGSFGEVLALLLTRKDLENLKAQLDKLILRVVGINNNVIR